MLKRASLVLLVVVLAAAVQAGQGEGEGAKEQRLQKKSELQQMLQTKLWQGLRAQKQVRIEEPEAAVLKGEPAGEQPKSQEQTRTQDEKKTNMKDDPEKTPARIHKRPRDRAHEDSILKGEGAGPGDGTGDCEPIQLRTQTQTKKQESTGPAGEPKQDQIRDQKQDQLRDGSCNDGEAACMLKGEGAGPGDGTGDGEPIQDRTQTREQKKTAACPGPQEEKVQARTKKQEKVQAGVSEEEDEDELTPEFLMFLKSYFAEVDARQQREGEMAQIQQRLVKKVAEAQKTMVRTQKGN